MPEPSAPDDLHSQLGKLLAHSRRLRIHAEQVEAEIKRLSEEIERSTGTPPLVPGSLLGDIDVFPPEQSAGTADAPPLRLGPANERLFDGSADAAIESRSDEARSVVDRDLS